MCPRHGSDPALLWLWRRPMATALIRLLAWEPPYATGAALKRKNKIKQTPQRRPHILSKKKKRKEKENQLYIYILILFQILFPYRSLQDIEYCSLCYMAGPCWLSIFFFFGLFRAVPVAYGGSQARSRIRAVAAGLHHSHSNADPSHVCNLHHSSRQRQIFNPLGKAGDQTRNLMVSSRIR